MRFLHVITSVDRKTGGPVEALLQLGLVHQKLGHTIEVASADAPGSVHLDEMPFPVHALGPGKTSYVYCPRMAGWLEQHGPHFDAVIAHGLWQYPTNAVQAALSRKVPYFVYTHGMLDPWFNEQFLLKHIKKTFFWSAKLRKVLDEATGIIFTTEEEMERSIRSFFPFRWKGMVAPLGIAPPPAERFIPSTQSRFPELKGRRFLLFFGRIHPKKGCELLIQAFSRVAQDHPDIDLVMAGPGESSYIESMRNTIATAGLQDRVIWTGMITGDVKWELIRSADAFVLPSHQENFGIAVVESLAVHTPVLLSNKVQIWREVIRSGAGLVETDDLQGTELLLRRWLHLDDAERKRFRSRAGECFQSRFTAEQAGWTLLHEVMSILRSEMATSVVLREFSNSYTLG
ncbi:glycosyltransferase [Edaphobacter albus]|uniref:glycosyltransferase n=1 Tax=Edaphobacter sp. 4G125 TaxID=2763071 RepID=UPI001647719D|nr:glycosyltransferase [Edaphobacter sp. 4G125]QNI35780.1 glycosyltransferase [Edaphobacter sp. 4G125]